MMLGHWSIIDVSMKQKLNTRSTTKSKLIGPNDILPRII